MGVRSRIAGKLGRDYWGRFVIETLRSYPNINVDGVKIVDDEMTATTDIEVDTATGERTFYHHVGANASFSIHDISEASYGSDIFHVGGYNLIPSIGPSDLSAAYRKAHGAGARTSIDLAWSDRVDWTALTAAIPEIDLYFSNIDEARMVVASPEASADQVSKVIMDLGPEIVAIKLGPKGCHIRTRDEIIDMPADPQFIPVDGTGAGDAFVAGFLMGIGEGWDVAKTTRFANAAGGFCVSKPGATTGVPDRETILAFVEENPLSFTRRPAGD
jgi:sugar/nucleoside kinase (ribokinase family)